MAKAKIFIDGEHGTTGLQIRDRLAARADLDFIRLADAERKDPARRAEALNAADVAILCLPDDAAREAVAMVENDRTRIIDASTAHRTAPGWVYGFPEMTKEQPRLIAESHRIANCGCYATGTVALLRPLVTTGLVPKDYPVTITGVSGYSGGGKSLIAAFEDPSSKDYTKDNFRLYSLGLAHKHVEEMRVYSGLAHRPLFVPSVGRFAQGMLVIIPLELRTLPRRPSLADLHGALDAAYAGAEYVKVVPLEESLAIGVASSLDPRNPQPEALNGTNNLRLFVFGNETGGQAALLAQLDNLGKGASGQAVQCLDIILSAV
jgi:N-acetyl-gamma-glutamyl-phosphate reductase